jgi:signal peptidase I
LHPPEPFDPVEGSVQESLTPVELSPGPEKDSEVRSPSLLSRNSLWRDVIEILLLIVTIYTLVNLATARAVVEGASMQPNFYTGQLVIVNRFAYYFSEPQRGDVIVLHDPQDPAQDFIKRVVGLPGEVVQIKEGRVYVNGTRTEEPYIARFCTSGCDGYWSLDSEQYFVLGDNRPNSHDSHSFGPIDRKLIVGKAWIRYWPPPDIGLIPGQSYGPISAVHPPTPTATNTAPPIPTHTPRSPLSPPSVRTPRPPGGIGG